MPISKGSLVMPSMASDGIQDTDVTAARNRTPLNLPGRPYSGSMSTGPPSDRMREHWAHLFDEVVTSGLCTGCAGCVVACPYDVLGYKDTEGVYKPFHIEEEGGPGGCGHGERGCTSCTRACPRFRSWEPEIDTHLFGRARRPDEVDGISKDIILARAADPEVLERGQDGGLV